MRVAGLFWLLVLLEVLGRAGAEAPPPSHLWDLRGCDVSVPVEDTNSSSSLTVTAVNGTMCTDEGMVFDGYRSSAFITPWRWGGVTSIEVLVRYNSFNYWSRIFDFGNGFDNENIDLRNEKGLIRFYSIQGRSYKSVTGSRWEYSSWTHVVLTAKGTSMKIYKNGVLAGTITDGWEPNVLTRTQNWLGRANRGGNYLNGTIAYLKMWHGTELSFSDVKALVPSNSTCAAPGKGLDMSDLEGCTACPPNTYGVLGACLGCPTGSSSIAGSKTCKPICEEGEIFDIESSGTCITCDNCMFCSTCPNAYECNDDGLNPKYDDYTKTSACTMCKDDYMKVRI